MRHPLELVEHQLWRSCNLDAYPFETTEEIPEMLGILGQERAEEAMRFGLGIQHNSYHLYVSGPRGMGKTTYTKKIIGSLSKEKPVPNDWCYVYDFDQPDKAVALSLPPGRGRVFQREMKELLEEIIMQVSAAFNSEDYDRQRNEINKRYQEEKNRLLTYLTLYARERNYLIKGTSTGFIFRAMLQEKELTDEEYERLDEREKQALEEQLQDIQEKALEVIVKIKNVERLAKKRLLQLETKVGMFIVKPIFQELLEAYGDCPKVVAHLKKVQADIVENIYQFVLDEEELLNPAEKLESEPALRKYWVNLFVDNSQLEGAPLIMEYNPTLSRLTGAIEYVQVGGQLKASFLNLKPGAIHMANGGYLVLEAKKLLSHPLSWEALKRILQTREITIEGMGSQMGMGDTVSLKVEPIPIQMKVVLIGNESIYYLLHQHDEDFRKYFKVLVDFQGEMERTPENEYRLAQLIGSYARNKGLRPIDRSGAEALIEYSSRMAGNQNKLSTQFNLITEMIIEADYWAQGNHCSVISREEVEQAMAHKAFRIGKLKDRVFEEFKNRKVLIDLKGHKVGVVNGLSVLHVGELVFGRPNVITATTAMGREGVINIEREVHLSGNFYDKGVQILTGFLWEQLAAEKPLSITARVCFEQSYGEVEGDSASSGELCAILSSLSGIPIKQGIAITGSMNQKGFIQPVGGVTEKIEGFFDLCQHRGFTGKQGVIIPYHNLDNLMLSKEVVQAVKEGKFHIYGARHVHEALEILTGVSPGVLYEKIRERIAKQEEDESTGNRRENR